MIHRNKHTVLEGVFDETDITQIKAKMGVGGFSVLTTEKIQKHGLKARNQQLAMMVLRGHHWGQSNNHLKLKKVLLRLGIKIELRQ